MGNNTLFHSSDVLYTDTYWEDITFSTHFRLAAANNPTDIIYPANGGQIYCFDTSDYLTFVQQIPHSMKCYTNARLHLHWTPHTRGVAESGNTVNWRVNLSIAATETLGGTFPTVTTYDLTDTCTGVDNSHLKTADAIVDLSGFNCLSSVISGRVYRLAGDTWSGSGVNAPGLLEVDFHVEVDRPGSRQEYIK